MNNTTMPAVKITCEGETRRFPGGALPLHSLAELRARLDSEFPAGSGRALRYTDEEGDLVTVRSQPEWEEAIACLRATGKVPQFLMEKDGEKEKKKKPATPLPPFLSFVGDVLAEVQKEAEAQKDAEEPSTRSTAPPSVPFPFGAFPIHIACSNEPCEAQSEDQKDHCRREQGVFRFPFACGAGVAGLAERANQRAVELMKAHDHKGAATVLEKAASHWPCDALTHYNLACARALSGECDAAMGSLTRSLGLGFSDSSLLATDPDLDALRTRPDFALLLAQHNVADEAKASEEPKRTQSPRVLQPPTLPLPHPIFSGRNLFFHPMPAPGPAHSPKPEEGRPDTQPIVPNAFRVSEGFHTAPKAEGEAAQACQTAPDGSTRSFAATSMPSPYQEAEPEEVVVEGDWSDSSSSHTTQTADEREEEEEASAVAPFPYAREFAEVREIGVPVTDTVLRSLLEAHQGDVAATMGELCATPR